MSCEAALARESFNLTRTLARAYPELISDPGAGPDKKHLTRPRLVPPAEDPRTARPRGSKPPHQAVLLAALADSGLLAA